MQLINKSYFHFLQKIEFEISFESLPKDSYEMHNHFFLEKYEKKKTLQMFLKKYLEFQSVSNKK